MQHRLVPVLTVALALSLAAASMLLVVRVSKGSEPPPPPPHDAAPDAAARTDAQEISGSLGVSEDEVLRYLELQPLAGELDAALERNQADTFGGLSIEYDPYRIIVRATPGAAPYPEISQPQFEPLRDYIVLQEVRLPLASLRSALEEFLDTAPHSIEFDGGIDIDTNLIVLTARDALGAAELQRRVVAGDYGVPADAFQVSWGELAGPGESARPG